MDNKVVAFLYFHNHSFIPMALMPILIAASLQGTLRSHCLSSVSPPWPGSRGCCILCCPLWLEWHLLCSFQKVMFQSAGFLGFSKSCLIFLNYKLMTHIAPPGLKLAQQLELVKSQSAGKAKPVLPSRWQSLVCAATGKPEKKVRET